MLQAEESVAAIANRRIDSTLGIGMKREVGMLLPARWPYRFLSSRYVTAQSLRRPNHKFLLSNKTVDKLYRQGCLVTIRAYIDKRLMSCTDFHKRNIFVNLFTQMDRCT